MFSIKYDYRFEFIAGISKALLPSLLVGGALQRAFPYPTGLLQIPLYLAAFIATIIFRIQYDRYHQRRDAARHGAVLAPEIQGRWPGNIDILLKLGKSFHEDYFMSFQNSLFDQLQSDTINFRILWKDLIMTRDHNVMKTVLATGFHDFGKGVMNKTKLFGLFGNGIFNSDGEEWKVHRGLTRPFFARERVRDFEYFEHYSNKAIDLFRTRALSGESVDVQDVFGRFTQDAAGEFLFGTTKLNTLDLPLPKPGEAVLGSKGTLSGGDYGSFVDAFEQMQSIIAARSRRSWLWPLYEWFGDATAPYNKVIDDWVAPLINDALDAKKKRGAAKIGANDGSLTDHLVDSTDNVALIREELIGILIASRDTTAALLTFMVYLLSQYPDVFRKLRTEIIESVPEKAPTFDDIRNMRYLRACLNESLRLFPAVPINSRASIRPSVLPSTPGSKPIYMPGPHVNLTYSDFLMQRRKDLWGPDADKFSPERWIDPERLKIVTSDPYKFIPFNAGPRICLGQNFAYNEASFMMVRLLQVFDEFELRQEDAPPGSIPPASWKHMGGRASIEKAWPLAAISMYSKGGMWIRMHIANTGAE